ncbi:MAG: response regulator [Mucilaginibacter sp.]|jgi:CheY-like chemotaxis protein|nr:response regulator [Mucilaginibacter sp.]
MGNKGDERKINILLVDDDEINNFIHTIIIEKALPNSKIAIVADLNGKQAINHLKQFKTNDPLGFPDYIFLDINMPEMNGWEFLDEYTKRKLDAVKHSKIYITTSSIFNGDVAKSNTYPCVKDFLSKPLTMEKVRAIFND